MTPTPANASLPGLQAVPQPDLRATLLNLCERYALEADIYRKPVGDGDQPEMSYLNGFHAGIRSALTRAITDLKQALA